MREVINVFSPTWNIAESYGRVALELTKGLRRQGVHVNTIGGNPPGGDFLPAVGGIALGYPTNLFTFGKMLQHGPVVWITTFESTELPFGWSSVLNEAAAVVVPSRWNIDLFKSCGVQTPIHCIPQGISHAFKSVKRQPDRPYTFIAIADRGRRKGWHIAGFAFRKAFGDDPNYRLIYKRRPGDVSFTIGHPNIDIIEADYTDRQMANLYASADCMLFPAAGEGYGFPPREFAATGGTSIVTNWSGTADDIEKWALPINYKLVPAWQGAKGLEGLGLWAEADDDDLAMTMTHVARHRDYYANRALEASAFVRKSYRWSDYSKRVLSIWRDAVHAYTAKRAAVS